MFDSGVNPFAKFVTGMIVENRQECLAEYLSLVPHAAEFVNHVEEIHTQEGFTSDGTGFTERDLAKHGGYLEELRDFRKAALESASVIAAPVSSSDDISKFFNIGKRKSEESNPKAKKTKAILIDENETTELQDEEGLEREYQQSFVGMAYIPLDNINIADDLKMNLSKLRIFSIKESMKKKFDPSICIPVVCPEGDQTVLNLKDVDSQTFAVVQKIHSVSAFKDLDVSGEFSKLPGHSKRKVLCFVLRATSSGLIHYGNMRANQIQAQFSRKTVPQDLLRIYQSLSSKDSSSKPSLVVERMAKLSRIGPNECIALRKLCSWSVDGLKALMEVISQFEKFKTMDVKPKGHVLALLRGEKMTMTHKLFRMLAKVDYSYFLSVYREILENRCSLNECVENFNKLKEVEKVSAALRVLVGYEDLEKIKEEHPGKFGPEELEQYRGAEVASDGSKNEQAKRLEEYLHYMIGQDIDDDSFDNNINFVECEILGSNSAGAFASFDTLIFLMKEEKSQDFLTELIQQRLYSGEKYQATLISFPSEALQFQVLTLLRNHERSNEDNFRIIPLLFFGDSLLTGDVAENIRFSVLFGFFTILSPPLNMCQNSMSNLINVVEKISPVYSKLALISDSSFVKVHSETLTRKVTYIGQADELKKIESSIQKRSKGKGLTAQREVDHNNQPEQQLNESNQNYIASCSVEVNLTESQFSTNFGLRKVAADYKEGSVKEAKKSLSSVFDYEDDPLVVEIMARRKKEAEVLAARIKVKTKGMKKKSMAKMAEFSQLVCGSRSIQVKLSAKKKILSGSRSSNTVFAERNNFNPSIDDLLKIPKDGGKSMDEVLDELDKEIAARQKRHEEEMKKVDADIAAENRRQEELTERMRFNLILRDRLEAEVTKPVLQQMFSDNLEYLKGILSGKEKSSRNEAFHKSARTRHAIYYSMITDPFTDDQLDWTLELMGKVWMKTKREQMDMNELVWKVLLPECFIKFYMDHFSVSKAEAEKRISETPLPNEGDEKI